MKADRLRQSSKTEHGRSEFSWLHLLLLGSAPFVPPAVLQPKAAQGEGRDAAEVEEHVSGVVAGHGISYCSVPLMSSLQGREAQDGQGHQTGGEPEPDPPLHWTAGQAASESLPRHLYI